MEISEELYQMVQPGKSVRLGRHRPKRIHIRAIVDEDQVVYRFWRRRVNDWEYRVEWLYTFQLWYEDGSLAAA
ncbi:MAG: hypothetical protein E6R03_15225 [Hyphomicrobiaceae bacterium]|nr:MAG: hypothetical protein E6R03_15225 [Hyphomicrobiaceae bacterium]